VPRPPRLSVPPPTLEAVEDEASRGPALAFELQAPRPVVQFDSGELAKFIEAFNSDDKSALTANELRRLDDLHLSSQALIWLGSEVVIGSANAIEWIAAMLVRPGSDDGGRERATVVRRDRAERWRDRIGVVLGAPKPSARYLPPNLKSIRNGWLLSYLRIAEEGIALYGVPRASIAQEFLSASGKEQRRALLEDRSEAIVTDCQRALDAIADVSHVDAVRMAAKAVEALASGHSEAAQALVASVLTALKGEVQTLGRQFTDERVLPPRRAAQPAGLKDLPLRMHLGFAPLWLAYAHFLAEQDDPIPAEFSRHATAHTVHPHQFTLANAVQGVMVMTSLLYLLAELDADAVSGTQAAGTDGE
jgi:hypothetical protein